MYSDLYLRPHYQPSRILIAMALMAVVGFGIFYYSSDSVPTRASKKTVKKQDIVNVTPRQVGIYWESDSVDEAWILFGESENNINTLAPDVFTAKGEAPKRSYHYAELKNLNPDTTYYYQIVSDNEIIMNGQQKPFTVRTASSVGSSGSLTPAYGKIAKSNGEAVKNAVIMLSIPEAYPLFTLTGSTGEWLIPLQYFVSRSRGTYIIATENTMAQITASYESESSKINTVLGKTHPLPQTVVLGENYTFLDSSNVLSAQSEVIRPNAAENKTYSVAIRYPRNNSVVPGDSPLIKGYGIPGKTVTVSISSNPAFSATVSVDKEGQWSVPLTRTFFPGKYTISAVTLNQNNKLVEIKHTYTLIKSGERVLGESTSTPSATVKPSPTVRLSTPTPTSRLTTPAPTTNVITPTSSLLSPTQSMLITQSPTVTPYGSYETPTPPPPASGVGNIAPYLMTGAGLMVVGAGLLLLL